MDTSVDRTASPSVKAVRVNAVGIGVGEIVGGPDLKGRKGEERLEAMNNQEGELGPVTCAEVHERIADDPVDHLLEVFRVHQCDEVSHLIEPIRIVQRQEPLSLLPVPPSSRAGQQLLNRGLESGESGLVPGHFASRCEEAGEEGAPHRAGLVFNLSFRVLREDLGRCHLDRGLTLPWSEEELTDPPPGSTPAGDQKAGPLLAIQIEEAQ